MSKSMGRLLRRCRSYPECFFYEGKSMTDIVTEPLKVDCDLKSIKKDYLLFLYQLIKQFQKFVFQNDIPTYVKYKDDLVIVGMYKIDRGILKDLKREYKELAKEVLHG